MKTLGIIGGMSWESSAGYYRLVNEGVAARLGGYHSAKMILYSVDFAEVEALQRADDWDRAGALLAEAARACVAAGAEVIGLATNTMHLVADVIEDAAGVPLIHIADATAEAVRASRVARVALLGTRFTMERAFYRERLEAYGLEVLVPEAKARSTIDRVIFEELVHGVVREESRRAYLDIIRRTTHGTAGVILGCTEIGYLVHQEHLSVPVFDTTRIHAEALVAAALAE
ncbi:MAG: aspartate/glutamate racemase family protein [Spirochaetaceae bacterium]